MDTFKIFRGLVIAAFVLVAVEIAAAFLAPDLPEHVQTWLDTEANGPLYAALETGPLAVQIAVGALLIAYLAAYLAALVGMLRYKPWARVTFLATILVGGALSFTGGSSLYTAFELTVAALVSMVEGALIVLLFVDPVRGRFRNAAAPA
jgi:hypothetical protein